MSGNPFRRPRPQAEQAPEPEWYSGDSTSIGRISPPPETERRPSKVKRVRIQTPPPLSPDSVHEDEEPSISRVADETHEGPPPPDPSRIDASVILPTASQDPFGRGVSEDELSANEEVLSNTRRNSASAGATIGDVPIIKNPFQKTLATMEPGKSTAPIVLEKSQEVEEGTLQGGRAGMDVDSFKRLLMTGTKDTALAEPSPAPSTATTATTSSYFTGDSSSTDASSVSRHSLSEQQTALSDLEDESSSSDQEDAHEMARHQQTGTQKKPPPPKPRHGRSIGPNRMPETVSFSEFSPTSDLTPAPRRQASKPVPPPPPPQQRKRTTGITLDSSPTDATHATSIMPSSRQSGSPAPISREPNVAPVSQHADRSTALPESASMLPEQAQAAVEKPGRRPPPPPSRRSGSNKDRPLESTPTSPSFERPELSYAPDTPSRSSSVSSHTRSMPPPPPPPRRQRGSSRSSMDQVSTSSPSQRPSMDDRRSSIGSLDRVVERKETRKGSGDAVLQDMDALQAEIDALKAKYGKKLS